MELTLHRAGMLTTVQDLGRRGYRSAGVPLSGAMDPLALRIANLLVGNPESAAALEISFVGPEFEVSADTLVALAGADCDGLPAWKPVAVRAGERVRLGACTRGCRSYLAIAGGIEVAAVLGSRSTYLRAGLGGLEGRALRDGDRLPVGVAAAAPRVGRGWSIDARILPPYSPHATVRVLRGAQADEFEPTLGTTEFRVSPQSDRMGLRLLGEPVTRRVTTDLLSAALLPGTIQVPPDGQPLLLMADAQTIGGYPQPAHVVSVDLPLVAQLRPGDTIRFTEIPLADAHRLLVQREHALAMLREGLARKLDLPSAG